MSTTVEEEEQEGPPHEAMFLVIAYLRVYEVLTMSRVCTSLRYAVNNDVLLWLKIIVENPLNSRLSDDTLLKITSKANGRLQTLALMNCIHVTDHGLQRVIEQNPFIEEVMFLERFLFCYCDSMVLIISKFCFIYKWTYDVSFSCLTVRIVSEGMWNSFNSTDQ